jgi:hypothetical protein
MVTQFGEAILVSPHRRSAVSENRPHGSFLSQEASDSLDGACDLIGNFCAQLRSRVRALVLSDFLDDGDFLRNGFHGRGVSLSD